MTEDEILVGHLFYGIGRDDGGYYVAVRLQVPNGVSRTMVADVRFRRFNDAFDFMRRMERDHRIHGQILGLTMTRENFQN